MANIIGKNSSVGFMFGSLMSIAYKGLAGAIVSLIAMMIIKKTDFLELWELVL